MDESSVMENARPIWKTKYGIPIRNLWYMLLYAWQELPHSPYWRTIDVTESPTLDSLLARLLVHMVQQRLRIGLGCDYQSEIQLLRGVRGRINFNASLKQRTFSKGQAICEFENYTIDCPKNQIIRSTLHHLAQVGEFGSDRKREAQLRHQLRMLVRTLNSIDLIELTPDIIHRQQLVRHDRDYRLMLYICDLYLQKRLPAEAEGEIFITKLERERLTLSQVYEKFVANFYHHHLDGWQVQAQKTLYWHEKESSPYLPVMRPDLVMKERATGRLIVLDTKFTARSLKENQWGKGMFDSGHLYQIYSYLQTQAHLSAQHRQATGILLYPAVDNPLNEFIEVQEQRIRVEAVDLAQPWPGIEARLLELVG